MEAEGRKLRCPLCCVQYVVRSEGDCQEHVSQCRAFHAEYGPTSIRSGLVDGFSQLPIGRETPPAAPSNPAETEVSRAFDRCALAVLPLVPLQLVEGERCKRTDEAVNLIAELTSIIYDAELKRSPSADEAGFDSRDLIEVSLGPILKPLGQTSSTTVATILSSFDVLVQCGIQRDNLASELQKRLLLQMNQLRYCASCGKSGCRLFQCSSCKQVYYCGPVCQRKAWDIHKVVCLNQKS